MDDKIINLKFRCWQTSLPVFNCQFFLRIYNLLENRVRERKFVDDFLKSVPRPFLQGSAPRASQASIFQARRLHHLFPTPFTVTFRKKYCYQRRKGCNTNNNSLCLHSGPVQPSQRSNARRMRSSRHNFTKENIDKCRKFHFNRKT